MRTLLFYEDPIVAAVLITIGLVCRPSLSLVALGILGALIVFYRDEDRTIENPDPTCVYSVCNGKVLRCNDREIIIFLSPLDMHTQKAPASGRIVARETKPGQFNPAFLLEKTEYNERVTTVFESVSGTRISVDQIAGQLARRIVGWKKVGDKIKAGQTFGMIKLSSQCRVHVPEGYECNVCVGERVIGGRTILFKKNVVQNNPIQIHPHS